MMTERRIRIIHRRWAVHECGRSERRFDRVTKIQVRTQTDIEFLRITDRQFVEQIMRMLPIVERLIVPRFSGLKKKRITAAAFRKWIQTHHQARTELRVVPKRAG